MAHLPLNKGVVTIVTRIGSATKREGGGGASDVLPLQKKGGTFLAILKGGRH